MLATQVFLLTVAGNDSVLFLNGMQVVSAEGGTRDCANMVETVAQSLAEYFGVPVERMDVDAPAFEDWTFGDLRRDLLNRGVLLPRLDPVTRDVANRYNNGSLRDSTDNEDPLFPKQKHAATGSKLPYWVWVGEQYQDCRDRLGASGVNVFPDPDHPGRYYFVMDGEGSDISYDSEWDAWTAAIAQAGLAAAHTCVLMEIANES